MKERNYSFDIMRVIACIMIICMHSVMPTEQTNAIFVLSVCYFTEPGLCLFFVISGALLLPVKIETKTFLCKRLSKVVLPTLIFSFLYLILDAISGEEVNWFRSICSIPFSVQGQEVLWFMYTIIGLYLLSPIISAWLNNASKREEEFYLGLWGITMCYPLLKLLLDINESNTGILYYFSGYSGYFIMGHYLNKYPKVLNIKKLVLPVGISIAIPIVCKLMHIKVDYYSIFWYPSIFVATLTVAIYVVISKYSKKLIAKRKVMKVITQLSNLSFGIYLVQIAIIRFFLWKCEWIINLNNYILQWTIVVAITFILSWVVTYIISLLPFGDYIIGYKSKK